jgi:hypothetical protein
MVTIFLEIFSPPSCTYKVVQIWPGLFMCKQVTVCPGHIWTTLYLNIPSFNNLYAFRYGLCHATMQTSGTAVAVISRNMLPSSLGQKVMLQPRKSCTLHRFCWCPLQILFHFALSQLLKTSLNNYYLLFLFIIIIIIINFR